MYTGTSSVTKYKKSLRHQGSRKTTAKDKDTHVRMMERPCRIRVISRYVLMCLDDPSVQNVQHAGYDPNLHEC